MNPLFDVPFLPEPGYVEFLEKKVDDIDSVHFSLFHQDRMDSRILLPNENDREENLRQLKRLRGPKKYALLNSRFYPLSLFTQKEHCQQLIHALQSCKESGVLDGIVYSDHYLLQLLAQEAPSLAAELEAVPSINCMLDTYAKIEAQLSYISGTGFKAPGKIVLDRSLNRDLNSLAKISMQVHARFPDIYIEVLANEGCLSHCPFKLSHDAYIAQANINGDIPLNNLNCNLGCMKLFEQEPHRILFSPFIRPEDIDLYLYHVDIIKICGRTLGGDFLQKVITAYLQRQHDGNLLDLMDASHWLADKLYIDNRLLSFDFANTLSMCDHQCDVCGFCEEIFETVAQPQPVNLVDYR